MNIIIIVIIIIIKQIFLHLLKIFSKLRICLLVHHLRKINLYYCCWDLKQELNWYRLFSQSYYQWLWANFLRFYGQMLFKYYQEFKLARALIILDLAKDSINLDRFWINFHCFQKQKIKIELFDLCSLL